MYIKITDISKVTERRKIEIRFFLVFPWNWKKERFV